MEDLRRRASKRTVGKATPKSTQVRKKSKGPRDFSTPKDPEEKRGRESYLEQGLVDVDYVCELVAEGLPFVHVAYGIGVNPNTLKDWIRKGHEEYGEPYNDFYTRVMEARFQAVQSRVRAVKVAQTDDWRAAAFWLERCEYKHFGANVKHTGDPDAPVSVNANVSSAPPEDVAAAVLGILIEAGALEPGATGEADPEA